MTSYFEGCETVADLKTRYRELAHQYHPDHGGDAETMKAINAELETALDRLMQHNAESFAKAHGWEHAPHTGAFSAVLSVIIDWNMRIEIIGFWIYCFDSFEYREKLKELGFWFSRKHKAWIFSGRKKRKIRTNLTLDDIRMNHGAELVREKEKERQIEDASA